MKIMGIWRIENDCTQMGRGYVCRDWGSINAEVGSTNRKSLEEYFGVEQPSNDSSVVECWLVDFLLAAYQALCVSECRDVNNLCVILCIQL